MKRVLLTGGSGFIGRNIAVELGGDYELRLPTSQELDLIDREAVGAYLRRHRITHVIHTAVYDRRRRERDPERDLRANLSMFFHLVEHEEELERIVYLGSGAEFDKRRSIVLAEETALGRSVPLLNDYGLSKYLMALHAKTSKKIYDLRLFGVYGPYEDWRTCFISNLCCKALYGLPLTIRQECHFDFMYVDDLMGPLRWALEGAPRFHDYNVCTGRPVLLSDIARLVCRVAGKDLPIQILSGGMGLEYTGSPARLRAELPFELTPLEDGVARLYRFYEEHPEVCDVDTLKRTK